MEKKLQEKEKELSRLNLRITREIMDMNIGKELQINIKNGH